jgi:two-component system, NtrC family, sensor kinase
VNAPAYPHPDAAALVEAVLDLGRHLHLDMAEPDLVGRFLGVLGRLLPGRVLAVRVFDPRTVEPARAFVAGAELRARLDEAPITLRESAIAGSGMKSAVAASARIRIAPRWDSPFHHVAAGFAVPLVAAGELYGALDVGYPAAGPPEVAAADEKLVLPLANQLAVVLRGHKLFKDSLRLRDFTAGLIEHANALIVGIDPRWRITVCNRAMLELTGFHRDEVLGRDLRDFLPSDQRTRLTRAFTQALRGDSQDAVDVMLHTRRGGRLRTVWSIAAIGARPVEAVVAIGQDQSKLEDLQQQIIQAERLATLGQLAAGVVHELNNPLTSITVYAEYLLGKALRDPACPDPDREKLRRILGSAQRILTFTRELVQYAKPVSSELDAIDVNDVVRQAVSFCEHLFERSAIQLTVDLDHDVPPLHAVPGQLEQVLINLVTNAAHAVEQGGVIAVRTRARRREVVIEVADSGPGIAEPDRDRVFEPFYTTKVDGKGTGLGLSIVKNIVEHHQGWVTVGTAPEGGALFSVIVPLVT